MTSVTLVCAGLLVFVLGVSAQSYTLEMTVFVENGLTLNEMSKTPSTTYGNLRQQAQDSLVKDILYMGSEVNKALATMSQYGLNIDLRLKQVVFLNIDVMTTYMDGTTNVIDSALGKLLFQNFLTQQNAYATYGYDYALLLTKSNLYGTGGLLESSNTNVGAVCNNKSSLTVAEFTGTYSDVITLSHAIGFLLGANNDDPSSTYIMSPTNFPTQANRWSFSSLSAGYIKLFVGQLRSSESTKATLVIQYIRMVNFGRDNDRTNCLLTTSYTSTKPSVSYGSYNGSILDPDVMCQRSLLTSNTYMCKSIPDVYLGPPKGDAVCSQIYCRVPSTMTCSGIFPSDGMPCDTRKRCVSGRCQPDYSAATQYLDSNCVWGNQKSLELPSISFVGNCATFLSLYKPLQCYTRIIQESCCASCKSYYTARAGCEYGDRSVDCVKYSREQVCPTYKDSLCCGYCAGYVGKRSVDGPVIAPTLNMTVPLGEKIHIKAEEYEDKLGRTH